MLTNNYLSVRSEIVKMEILSIVVFVMMCNKNMGQFGLFSIFDEFNVFSCNGKWSRVNSHQRI